MSMYPEKYLYTTADSTANRGVEAKETEIANTHLDGDGGPPPRAGPAPPACPSYLQVVVEKRRAPPSPRAAPAPGDACTPALLTTHCMACGCSCGRGAGETGGAGDHASKDGAVDGGDGGAAECVEVYRFLRVGAARRLGGGGGERAAAWRRSARVRRGARAAARELGAAARLAAAGPLAAALLALRWTLALARDAAAGVVHAAADYGWKPALALAFNAALHPLLVFAANVARGAHEAARPLCAALGECAAHAATVLGALRLGAAPRRRRARRLLAI